MSIVGALRPPIVGPLGGVLGTGLPWESGGASVYFAPATNSVAPSIAGPVTLSAALVGARGTWANATSYLYRWKRDGVVIEGATELNYQPVAADLAIPASESFPQLTLEVAGVNAAGIAASYVASTAIAFNPSARIESLGAGTLASWVRGSGMTGTTTVTGYDDAGPNNHDFTQGTAANRPVRDSSGSLVFGTYDGTNDELTGGATSLYAATTEFHRLHVVRLTGVPSTSGAVGLFYLNAAICMDRQTGHTGDAFSTRSGTTYFQAGGYEAGVAGTGAAEVAVASPTTKHLYDSSLDTSNVLRAQVDAGAIGTRTRSGALVTTGTPFIFGASYLGSNCLAFEHYETLLCKKRLSAAVLADIRAYLGTKHAVTFEQEVAPSLAQTWGNGWDSTSGGNRFYSALSMFVFDTDSPWVDVEYYTNSAAVDPRYSALAVYKSATAAVKPTTQLGVVEPIATVGRHRSGRIATGATIGGGSVRIYVINGGLSGFVGAQAQRAWIADGAALTIQSEPAGATYSVEGWGSVKLGGSTSSVGATLGYYSTGGVLQGGAFATRRSEFLTRAAAYKPPSAIVVRSIETNDMTSGLAGADAGVQAAALLADLQSTFTGVPILWIAMCLRWTENAGTAAVRTAEAAACLAAGVDYVSEALGAEAFTTADMNPSPDVHPNDLGHVKEANATLTWLTAEGITGPVLEITNSIGNGSGEYSTGPDAGGQIYAAVNGCAALVRSGR